jgi:hypothetical protein
MPSQLVALATQARKALGLDELDELADDALPEPHMPISACLQPALPLELPSDDEVAKQVPHLAMMLSTAFSHIDVLDGQPVRPRNNNANPGTTRFMRPPHEKLFTEYIIPRCPDDRVGPIEAGEKPSPPRGARRRSPASMPDERAVPPRATRRATNPSQTYCGPAKTSIP